MRHYATGLMQPGLLKLKMMNELKFREDRLVLLCAFRYALGRRTYVVSEMVHEIISNWDRIRTQDKEIIKRDINAHKELYGDLGDTCDEEEWNKILELES